MKHKKAIIIISLFAIMLASIAGQSTFAYLQDNSSVSSASFAPAAVQITINDDFANNTITLAANTPKSMPVSITNEATSADGRSGTSAYIRVAIIPIWCHADGSGTALPSNNVTLILASSAATDWLLGKDGYYYYKYPVAAGSDTTQLLSAVSWHLTNTSLDAEYQACKLEVQVLADAIQSTTNTVENYWGVQVGSNGNLSLASNNTP